MKLLLDEHYSGEIAKELAEAGRDATTVIVCGLKGCEDEELLAFAAREHRALLTNNVRHFVPLARRWSAAGADHCGLIFTSDASMPRSRAGIGQYVRALGLLMDANPGDEALLNRVHWLLPGG